MNDKGKDNLVYVRHILDAISAIQSYTEGMNFRKFKEDPKTIDAVVRQFEIIGEASSKIPPQIRARYASVPWKSIIGLRNILIHDYMGIDIKRVWQVIKKELHPLKNERSSILDIDT